jgi:lipopolysaccharide heptosyltransferase II
MNKTKKNMKKLYLVIRGIKFSILSGFTFLLRRKKFNKESARNILVIALKRVGDTILSIPAYRAIKESLPQSQVTVFANSYVKDILERINSIDNVITYEKEFSYRKKAKTISKLSRNQFDLAVDLTCDYTFEGALLSYMSGAKYRVGYNIGARGFLFNRAVKHDKNNLHITDEILNIVRSINLDTKDKNIRIRASDEPEETIRQFLREGNVKDKDLLFGIHPGGFYPTQRWLKERFVEVADRVIDKYKARVVLIGGPGEEELIRQIIQKMKNKPLFFLNQPVRNLLALIQACHLLVCNNSGPLHMATALGTPTVSTMGPTIDKRWWPYGEGHVVIQKDLPCISCNEGYCRLKNHDCMGLITVEEVLEAIDLQISKIKRIKE